jgi:hypothetical protein
MHTAIGRLTTAWRRRSGRRALACVDEDRCSWEVMRATYEEQAARGVPEAVKGLELIRQDRWPTSGRPRG